MSSKTQGFSVVELILVLAVVVLVSGSGYLFYRNGNHAAQSKPKPPVAESQEELISNIPSATTAVTNTNDLDKTNQSINELDLDSNISQLKQLDSDVTQN